MCASYFQSRCHTMFEAFKRRIPGAQVLRIDALEPILSSTSVVALCEGSGGLIAGNCFWAAEYTKGYAGKRELVFGLTQHSFLTRVRMVSPVLGIIARPTAVHGAWPVTESRLPAIRVQREGDGTPLDHLHKT